MPRPFIALFVLLSVVGMVTTTTCPKSSPSPSSTKSCTINFDGRVELVSSPQLENPEEKENTNIDKNTSKPYLLDNHGHDHVPQQLD